MLDRENYTQDMPIIERYCVRAVIMKGDQLIAQRSSKGEYKIPGGGIEDGESEMETLKREVLEETGFHIRESEVREIGEVIEKRRDVFDDSCTYVNHTYFYSCAVEGQQQALSLTPEEKAKGYTVEVKPIKEIIAANDAIQKDYWRRRDTLFLKWLVENAN